VVNPVLWLIGTEIRFTSPSSAPNGRPIADGTRLSPPASMSFGRPVLPPEAIDFHTGDTDSGSGSADNPGSGSKSAAILGDTPLGSVRPTISAGGRNASSALSSASGSRADSGCGTAPSFHVASTACTHSIELGSSRVT